MKQIAKPKVVKKKRTRIALPTERVARVVRSKDAMDVQFETHRGKFARKEGKVGIVCGYSEKNMIMAVTNGAGWTDTKVDVTLVTYLDNKRGYCFIDENNIL